MALNWEGDFCCLPIRETIDANHHLPVQEGEKLTGKLMANRTTQVGASTLQQNLR